ncbi:MAG TPA: phosphotransferase [Mycobacteriales bacterium]|nr:phosphotransferase [Mycobacteriales bacterium]
MTEERFVPGPVLAQIADRTGVVLELITMARQGYSGGAAYVRWPDGRDGVVTCPPVSTELMHLTAEILALAKSRGLPVPRHDLVVQLADGGTAVVQERLPGRHIRQVDVAMVDALVEMNDRFAGLLSGRPDVPRPSLCLRRSAEHRPRHELLDRYSARTREMLQLIQEIGDEVPDHIAGDDLLHVDYARGNVLSDENGRITGVVDWNLGVARGDRLLALVSLRSDLQWSALFPEGAGGVERAAIDHLDRILEARIDLTTLRAYWAFWTLMKLDGLIEENAPRAIELFLDLGFRRLT